MYTTKNVIYERYFMYVDMPSCFTIDMVLTVLL